MSSEKTTYNQPHFYVLGSKYKSTPTELLYSCSSLGLNSTGTLASANS